MKFFRGAREYIGKHLLTAKSGQNVRVAKVCSINDARSVGILYNATNPVSFEIIKTFTKVLLQKKIEVSALGYVDSKKLIDHYLYRKGFDFFTKNELNWYYKPVSNIVDDFIKKPFDIFINLSLEDYYPIQYITALSVSSFKVGKLFREPFYLDMMIDIEKEKRAMKDLKEEIAKDKKMNGSKREIEEEVEKKVEIELQLNFLINQIMHYLSIIKSN